MGLPHIQVDIRVGSDFDLQYLKIEGHHIHVSCSFSFWNGLGIPPAFPHFSFSSLPHLCGERGARWAKSTHARCGFGGGLHDAISRLVGDCISVFPRGISGHPNSPNSRNRVCLTGCSIRLPFVLVRRVGSHGRVSIRA